MDSWPTLQSLSQCVLAATSIYLAPLAQPLSLMALIATANRLRPRPPQAVEAPNARPVQAGFLAFVLAAAYLAFRDTVAAMTDTRGVEAGLKIALCYRVAQCLEARFWFLGGLVVVLGRWMGRVVRRVGALMGVGGGETRAVSPLGAEGASESGGTGETLLGAPCEQRESSGTVDNEESVAGASNAEGAAGLSLTERPLLEAPDSAESTAADSSQDTPADVSGAGECVGDVPEDGDQEKAETGEPSPEVVVEIEWVDVGRDVPSQTNGTMNDGMMKGPRRRSRKRKQEVGVVETAEVPVGDHGSSL
ncbi:Uu.00g037850.m01.CDS01 [Anthostomella pinea]|uniref:Uu.00g037850.m01.CDS01 n=1 Tax=Anthostomella pinea TaxID=933095 RepID=A0AAI8VA75_9PEZI|nr:Uu.00g037850.m01.CDS01 [Anthostomella pinea]